jgi:hypothetical protein
MKRPSNTRILRLLLVSLAASALINGTEVLAQWHIVTSSTGPDLRWVYFWLFLPFAAAALVIPAAAIGMAFRHIRLHCFLVAVFCVGYLITASICFAAANRVRIYGMHRLAERTEKLITAIREHEARYGRPPAALENLVPEFLTFVPDTGIAAYPKFEYLTGEKAKEWNDNPWVLYVKTPLGGINWDMFMYFPNENYPGSGYGGTLERVGKWAYVHE